MPEGVEPTLRKLDLTIARLRLLLADVTAREASLRAQHQTFEDQREKLITFGLYGDSTLDTVLGMLSDVGERLRQAEQTTDQLRAIRQRAETELESLQITKGIEEARALLAQLQARQTEGAGTTGELSDPEIAAEIARLQAMINEASERAAKTIGRSTRHSR